MKILQLYKMFNFLVIYILEAKASYVFFFFFFNQIFSHRDGRDKCEFYYYFITIFKYNIIILKILIIFF